MNWNKNYQDFDICPKFFSRLLHQLKYFFNLLQINDDFTFTANKTNLMKIFGNTMNGFTNDFTTDSFFWSQIFTMDDFFLYHAHNRPTNFIWYTRPRTTLSLLRCTTKNIFSISFRSSINMQSFTFFMIRITYLVKKTLINPLLREFSQLCSKICSKFWWFAIMSLQILIWAN